MGEPGPSAAISDPETEQRAARPHDSSRTRRPRQARRPRRRARRQAPVYLEVLIAVGAVILIQLFVAKPFVVPSQSMENTLQIRDRILVNRLDTSIERFDIVVFSHGNTWADARLPTPESRLERWKRNVGDVVGIGLQGNTDFTVKRVIGKPGEKVACCDPTGHVLVNNVPIAEPWVYQDLEFTSGTLDCSSEPRSTRCFPEITVPADHYLVMGDHRSDSADSVQSCRGHAEAAGCAKFVPKGRIVGPAVVRIWPVNRLGTLG